MEGWIKVHRKLSENGIWLSEPFTRGQAWIDLLILANHDYSFFYKRNVKIEVHRGQLGRSEVELSDRWKWSRSKVRKYLNDLEKEQQIKQHKSNVTLIITIINYNLYQEKEQQDEQQKDSKKTAKRQQKDTYKNVENVKNVENDKEINNIPTLDEFLKYTKENDQQFYLRKNGIELKYKSWVQNGWKDGNGKNIKNWKSKILNTISYIPIEKSQTNNSNGSGGKLAI